MDFVFSPKKKKKFLLPNPKWKETLEFFSCINGRGNTEIKYLEQNDSCCDFLQNINCKWELTKLIMSKPSLGRTGASANLNWVEPSFDDLFEESSLTCINSYAKPFGLSNEEPKSKAQSSKLHQRGKSRAKKRTKPVSIQQTCERSKQNINQVQNEPWVDKYRPEAQAELAVHKKKTEEVESWLKAHAIQRNPNQGGSVLLLTGPPGCGKTATLQVLAKELGIQVQEWTNPVTSEFKTDFREVFDPDSNFRAFTSESQTALFQEFLLRANKYNKLLMLGESLNTDKRLVLVEDLPNQFYRDPACLHEILRKFMRTGRCPLVFIVSDSLSGNSNQRFLFPKDIQDELNVYNINFNPVAPTSMMKVLNQIAIQEASRSGGKITILDKTSLELLCTGSSGDIRSAINSLQFSCLKGYSLENHLWSRKKGKALPQGSATSTRKNRKVKLEKQNDLQAIGGKDASLFLFRALGKILYCKRDPSTVMEFPHLPAHLSEHERDPLQMEPESRSTLREYCASVAARGMAHSNKARGFANSQGGLGFKPLHKPQWLQIHKKYRENCLAARSLFSSFCLAPLCLQTQLLPYLALLTNPMQNQAQISFIQDVGRFPLKRYPTRLKLEALTDKDPGAMDVDSDDEGEVSANPKSIIALEETSGVNEEVQLNSPSLPSSQSATGDLPGSQPQPTTAQAIMGEEEIRIEEYDSD
ncbi:cell cycle checkpoint protein RAD17 isoform X2 [Latimeria chalumnae]|uniref:cell cycle checkpoint protein RAD17 isoform X2 n=1 Tax=Latimeria chalumnae TaxID=7897 RepID=UPI0003C18387|nr:PREDICTED: cell cycle checkpoint protein RAD17 isoform X2 [Latimeria chalumnae]|eukprot:XP_006004443.1 PREDICTED: cell cycle checkpoint protein RAD17 isoform X2 [Latimeria chalumnae]